VIIGFAAFRMDPKIGPLQVYKSKSIKEISHQETIAIFASHNVFTRGFRGVYVGNRTWATYVHPPWIIGLLLTEDEPIGPLGPPLQKILENVQLDDDPPDSQWETLYHAITQELESSPAADLLTSTRTRTFLKALLDSGITHFDPSFNFEIGPIYPTADRLTGTNSYDTRLFLEKLRLAGIFHREPVSGIIHCPVCHGFKVVNRLACPNCSIPTLQEVQVDIPGESTASESKPYLTCLTCSNTTQNPIITLLCTECGSRFLPSEAEYRLIMTRLVLNEKTARRLIQEVEEPNKN
jgi:hypothetical protein